MFARETDVALEEGKKRARGPYGVPPRTWLDPEADGMGISSLRIEVWCLIREVQCLYTVSVKMGAWGEAVEGCTGTSSIWSLPSDVGSDMADKGGGVDIVA